MARAPKDYAAERKKLQEKLEAMLAKQAAADRRIQEANRRQIVRFVEGANAADLPPEVLMGLILDGMERAKNPMHAASFRRRGEEHFTRKPRQPRAAKEPGNEPTSGDQSEPEAQAA